MPLPHIEEDLIRKLAEVEHKQWSHWALELSKSQEIEPERLERWNALIRTHFEDLHPDQQKSDLKWAKEAFEVIKPVLRMLEFQNENLDKFQLVGSDGLWIVSWTFEEVSSFVERAKNSDIFAKSKMAKWRIERYRD